MESARTDYDTVDEMFSHLDTRSTRATDQLADEQRTIVGGSKVVTIREDIVRFGNILTHSEIVAMSLLAGETSEGADSYATAVQLDDGRAFGLWFSAPLPGGEIGSTHKFNLWPINDYAFGVAEACDWQVSAIPAHAWGLILGALTQLAEHMKQVGGI